MLLETFTDFHWVPTSALLSLVIRSCPSANVVSWDCPVQITVSNIPGQYHVEGTILGGRDLPTWEVPVHPGKSAFSFPIGSGGDHDKLEAHFFEPPYTTQSVRNRRGIIDPVRLEVFLYFALKGGMSQCRANEALIETLRQSPWVFPNQDSVDDSALAV